MADALGDTGPDDSAQRGFNQALHADKKHNEQKYIS